MGIQFSENIVGKEEIADYAIPSFPTMFSKGVCC